SWFSPGLVLFVSFQILRKIEPKEKPKAPEVQTQKKKIKITPESEARVQTRERALQSGDETDGTRVKRRRTTAAAPGDEDDGPEFWVKRRQKLKENKRKEKERETRTVFVGNLPLSSTKKTLRVLFKDKGPIESIRFRSLVREDPSVSRKVAGIMRSAHPQKQSINAYVVFKDEESVTSALDRNGLELEPDLFIRVDRVSASASHDHKRSVFVGNLPFDLQEVLLRRHFEDCGGVEAVRLIRDPQTGLGKGFGYLLFQTVDSVQLALKLDGSKLEGRSIRVQRSVHREKPTGKNQTHPRKQTRPGSKPGTKPGSKLGSKPGSKPGTKSGTKPGQFRGEMADPTKKKKKKLIKKKKKAAKERKVKGL
ncbi:RNA-binding protein 34, partial [Boleophthalmus pectinirostris]|uniref:RNA-binding protein 34 n=1 Tax=Boleophthalmus pectinirostris TaxID=150288 RepID=UPI00242B738D